MVMIAMVVIVSFSICVKSSRRAWVIYQTIPIVALLLALNDNSGPLRMGEPSHTSMPTGPEAAEVELAGASDVVVGATSLIWIVLVLSDAKVFYDTETVKMYFRYYALIIFKEWKRKRKPTKIG